MANPTDDFKRIMGEIPEEMHKKNHIELIPKPILFPINQSFRTILLIKGSICYSKFEIYGRNSEFWDQLIV
jgi:hypothetical protein